MAKDTRKDFETLGQAARRLLEKLDERRKASGSLEGPSKFDAGGFGIMGEGTAPGEKTHRVTAWERPDRPLNRDKQDAVTDRAGREGSTLSVDIGNLHAAGERPGVRLSSGRRPAARAADNDNGVHTGTFWRWS
ncbi:hypothetical protein QEZ48_19595 [Aquamicrobium lusatiense]|uniref:hypothetical protein n=1 Tax=Aquamicrobium lusatiense TaxID=89772 RepID=UPI002456BA86|nr:hypothetical protein [Aquamicrobium lusatiense]MDH4993022.1 hypothetical protein [Aquamicrobium lusatiense]